MEQSVEAVEAEALNLMVEAEMESAIGTRETPVMANPPMQ